MIFVTVGITSFDRLIKEVDRYAKKNKEKVVCQIGNDGLYLPKKCGYFRMKDDISEEMERADLIITHGGGATTFEALNMGKRVIAVNNPDMMDQHQTDLVGHLAQEGLLVKGDLGKIDKAISSSKELKKYKRPKCTIHAKIRL